MDKHHHDRYLRFIESRRHRTIEGIVEVHHIVPRALGGTDDEDNLIELSPREHFIAHWMLWKAYKRNETAFAFWMMSNVKKQKINSRTYEKIRKDASNALVGNKHSLGVSPPKELREWFSVFHKSLWTEERRKQQSKRRAKANVESGTKVTIDGVNYPSIREASRQTGLHRKQIMRDYL